MKIFNFDPATGKRGDLIREAKCISWTDQSAEWQAKQDIIEPIACVVPESNDRNHYMVHVDAGVERVTDDGIKFDSYRYETQWCMMCMGLILNNWSGDYWEWIILPPGNLIRQIEPDDSYDAGVSIGDLARDAKDPHDIYS